MKQVKVKLADCNSKLPVYAKDGDSCADLYANVILTDGGRSNSIVIEPGARKLIKTGVSIQMPVGYEAQVRPRSGLAYKDGIYVHFGTIDNKYRGDVGVLIFNLGDKDFVVNHGDRVAQLAIVPIQQFDFVEVFDIEETERGAGGFGHTGVK